MKQADIMLKLDKSTEIVRKNVTTIEALFLVAEHQKNVGGTPVTVIESTIADAMSFSDPKKPRSLDEELDRLRAKYHPDKLIGILNQVRELPGDDFKKAIQRGMTVAMPSVKEPEFKLI